MKKEKNRKKKTEEQRVKEKVVEDEIIEDEIVEDEIINTLGDNIADATLLVVCTVTVPEKLENMTVNLKAPVIINMDTNRGVQLIADNDDYQVRYPIYDILNAEKDVEEFVSVFDAELLDEQPDCVGRLFLQVAVLDVEYLVEEFADMEAEPHLFGLRQGVRIFVFVNPAFVGSREFKLVPVVLLPFGG